MTGTAVVGGGIVGAAAAWRLAERGESVTLFDRRDEGRATDAGAGIAYAPPVEQLAPPDRELAIRSHRYLGVLAETLRSQYDLDTVGVTERPFYKVALETQSLVTTGIDTVRRYIDRVDHLQQSAVTVLDEQDVRTAVPWLRDVEGAITFETGIRIDGRRLTEALVNAGTEEGLEVCNTDVSGIEVNGGRVNGLKIGDGEVIDVDRVIIAGGAWSAAFASALGCSIPVSPQRGQIIHLGHADLATGDWPMVSTFDGGQYLVPWAEGRVAVGATWEDAGFAPWPTVDGIETMLACARDLVPSLETARFHEVRVGLRPRSPDGRPILGKVPDIDGAFVATGHGGGGLQRGPFSGYLVADRCLQGAVEFPLEAFRPGRFAEAG